MLRRLHPPQKWWRHPWARQKRSARVFSGPLGPPSYLSVMPCSPKASKMCRRKRGVRIVDRVGRLGDIRAERPTQCHLLALAVAAIKPPMYWR